MGFEYKPYLVFFINSYSCLFIFIELQDLLRILNSVLCRRFYPLQLIGNSKLFPFVCAKCMVRKHLNLGNRFQCINKLSCTNQILIFIRDTGNQYGSTS